MDKEDLIKNSEGILQSGKHLKALLDSLIEWSKVNLEGMNKREGTVNIANLLKSIFQDIETNLKWKKIKVVADIKIDYEINFDKDALRVVLRNLITNSIKFSNEGGTIKITAYHNKITIEDDGIGFPKDFISNENKSGTTRKGTKNEQGHGLGLQIVMDICKMYNTEVIISNRAEGGGKVQLVLN